jgi:hypothetical protein
VDPPPRPRRLPLPVSSADLFYLVLDYRALYFQHQFRRPLGAGNPPFGHHKKKLGLIPGRGIYVAFPMAKRVFHIRDGSAILRQEPQIKHVTLQSFHVRVVRRKKKSAAHLQFS